MNAKLTLIAVGLLGAITLACDRHALPSVPDAVPMQSDTETPAQESQWTGESVVAFLFDAERELMKALPSPGYGEPEPPFVGECLEKPVRGYWKVTDVFAVMDKTMTPHIRDCRMVDFGCRVGPWIGGIAEGPVFLPYRGSKATLVESTSERVVADVEELDNDSVDDSGEVITSTMPVGWKPTISRYTIEHQADGAWRVTNKTNLWNDGDCDLGPVVVYPTPRN